MLTLISARRAALCLILCVFACDGTPSVGADTDAATDTDAAAVTTPRLDAGSYVAATNGLVDDTCGSLSTLLELSAADANVGWTGEAEMEVSYPCCDVGYTCAVDAAGAVTCGGYVQRVPVPANLVLVSQVAVVDFAATSTTSFGQKEVVAFSCEGAACDAFAQELGTVFPCSVTLDERFAK